MSVTIATHNLNFDRPAPAQRRDVDKIREHADIWVTQEDVRRKGRRERVSHRTGIQAHGKGRVLASLSTRGQKIGLRSFVYRDYELDGIGEVRVISVHMPPLRMRTALYGIYAWRLRRFLGRSPMPWLAGGDWNWLLRADPAGLERAFGAKWFGTRIDGWAIHPALVQYVDKVWDVQDPKRHDNHPVVYLRLSPRVRLKEKR